MDATTIAVDLAKHTFEVVIAHGGAPVTRRRLSRAQFARFLRTQAPARVVMEACATAHYWARVAQACGDTSDNLVLKARRAATSRRWCRRSM